MSNSIHIFSKARDWLEEGLEEAKASFSLELVSCPRGQLEKRKGKQHLFVGCVMHTGVLFVFLLYYL